MHDFEKFWKILENVLLFTEIPTEKMLQRQIYVQNIQYDVLLRKGGGRVSGPAPFRSWGRSINPAIPLHIYTGGTYSVCLTGRGPLVARP